MGFSQPQIPSQRTSIQRERFSVPRHDKNTYNRERLIAARGQKREAELRELFKVMYRENGKVKIMEFMERGHCGYYRAVRIIEEMRENVGNMGVSE